jgi:hypothetical protein
MPKPRKPAQLRPLKTMRIFCEGAKTEPSYLNAYLDSIGRDNRQSVIEVEPTPKTTAVQLVGEAIKFLGSANCTPDDEVWVVYDRESVSKYSNALHARAYSQAGRAGVNVALTNVCFEYWLLLHLMQTDAPYSSYDNLITTSPFRREFKKASGVDYSKSDYAVFDILKPGLKAARARAKRINAEGVTCAAAGADKPYHVNPFVGVVQLLDAIDEFS